MFKKKLPRATPLILWIIASALLIFQAGNFVTKIYKLFNDKNSTKKTRKIQPLQNMIITHFILERSKIKKYLNFYLQKDNETPQILVKLNNNKVPNKLHGLIISLNKKTQYLTSIGTILTTKQSIEGKNFSNQLWKQFQEKPNFKLKIKNATKVKPNEIILQTIPKENKPQYKIFYDISDN